MLVLALGLVPSLATAQIGGQQARQRFQKNTKGVSIDDFVKHLASEDADERLEAVKSLGTSGEPKAVQYLLQAVGDIDERVQAKAIDYLGDLRASDSVPILVQYLSRSTVNSQLKPLILAALGKIGDTRAAAPIAEYLQRDLPASVRGTAVYALGEIAASESTDPLTKIANGDADPNVQRIATEALAKIEARRAALKREVKAPAQNFLKPKEEPPPR